MTVGGDSRGSSQEATLGASTAGQSHADADFRLARGTVVGRYVIVDVLGSGAMGVVYAAYDPELERRVALKLLHPSRGDTEGSDGRRRLLREAQAMARLSHRNVVAVHDIGEHEGRVFLAMELVVGRTFGTWLKDERPRWPAVLDVLAQAGEGLAAAHDKGLLHGDFKPDNVMIDGDGAVRVVDFGLARDGTIVSATDGADASAPALGALELSQTGFTAGTPAYMAPEKFARRSMGPHTDQFAFCVTLWQGLYGERPFLGATVVDLAANIVKGAIAEPPPHRGVPGWLRRIVRRGLETDPDRRWPSMHALLRALARGRARARRRLALVGLGALAIAGLAAAGWQQHDRRVAADRCAEEGASISEVWNDDIRERVRAALLATGVSHAEVTAEKVMPWLDDYVVQWQRARTEACLDAGVRGTWKGDVLSRSRWCLDERRVDLDALVTGLQAADAKSVEAAIMAASSLQLIESCRDADWLRQLPEPPSDQRDEVRAIGEILARARTLERMGAHADGLAEARAAHERATTLGWPPLRASASERVGELLRATGAYAAAEEMLLTAYFDASAAQAIDTAMDAADALAGVVGHHLGRPRDGLVWTRHAALLRSRGSDPTGFIEARQLESEAVLRAELGEYAVAAELYERVLAAEEAVLGPEHPQVASTLGNYAFVHHRTGEYEKAETTMRRVLAIQEEAFGPEHPATLRTLTNLGYVLYARSDDAAATALLHRVLSTRERALGPDHPEVATPLITLGMIHDRAGDHAKAKALQERALAIQERHLDATHPSIAGSHVNLGRTALATGAIDEAEAHFTSARATFEAALGPDHPDIAHPLVGLADVALARGEAARARALAERALALREPDAAPDMVADVCFSLARIHAALHEPEVARGYAQRARDGYTEAGAKSAVADVDAWLRANEAAARPR